MELKPPRKKKRCPSRLLKGPPLPIFVESLSGEFLTDDSASPVFKGCFNGYSVAVDNSEDMKMLYEMGNFGKGSLSRSFPNFGRHKNGKPPVINETQWRRRKEWIEKLKLVFGCQLPDSGLNTNDNAIPESKTTGDGEAMEAECAGGEITTGCASQEDGNENSATWKDGDILVIADLDKTCLDPKPRLETELIETVVEVLHLTLEEAFFLSYGLGCLEIFNLVDNELSPEELWQLFRKAQNDFVENYVAYHHYRAKGWIVKSGLKYGGNFLLYSKGPAFFHASYIVVVESIGKPGQELAVDEKPSWEKYSSLNRIAEQSNKELIICQVKWPSLEADDYKTVGIIPHFRVSDSIMGRWNASAKIPLND
uniref:tRNA-splicing endonuclease subunit Sen2 n=3 Tax=Lygus hesperus TaxID=30085 RepID=A0A0A9WLE0_LYGHE